ncbi:hypothetical protein [Amycolatopsis pittospori]|uniref:hypothetical protein n=1 Tax=Amycolatopsis pittospori TaxID=2749434 RepID=UPI0015F0F1F4|nr:hypothetical protein [Amycolatopsis pittospori]
MGQLVAGRGRGSRHRTGGPQTGAIRFWQCEIELCPPLFWTGFFGQVSRVPGPTVDVHPNGDASEVPMPDTIEASEPPTDDPVRQQDFAA